jgi:hypothetical protein
LIIGHIGLAFAARWKVPRAPLAILLVATFIPDLLRAFLRFAGFAEYAALGSHRFPWFVYLAIGTAVLAYVVTRSLPAAFITGALVILHIACDLISGTKELWSNGPDVALELQARAPAIEFLLETAMLFAGIALVRRTPVPRWVTSWVFIGFLLTTEALYVSSRFEPRFARRAVRIVRRQLRNEPDAGERRRLRLERENQQRGQ